MCVSMATIKRAFIHNCRDDNKSSHRVIYMSCVCGSGGGGVCREEIIVMFLC